MAIKKVIHEELIRHGQYIGKPDGLIALKQKDILYVYEFMGWLFDFDNTQILKKLFVLSINKLIVIIQ